MITLESLISFIKFGLENLHILEPKCEQIVVKDIIIVNDDCLSCSFYPTSQNSIDIKLEIVIIMGFFNGFFRDKTYENIKFNYYLVKAFDKNGEEILNALSTKSTAELIGTGNSIEWMKLTLFQENTNDYRLVQAKQIISEIENSIREIIKTELKKKFGENWWDESLNNKLGKGVKDTYESQFGEKIADGDILILYTYTLQLKTIISTHFNIFKSFFLNLSDFEKLMERLNKIRREEAHNRSISTSDLDNLKELHEKLISKIQIKLPYLQSVYLTTNWRLKIRQIMLERQYMAIHDEESILKDQSLFTKLIKIKENNIHLITYLNETITKLKSVSTPVHKREVQKDLVNCLEKFKVLHELLLDQTDTLDNDRISEIIKKLDELKMEMDEFSKSFLINEN